ncbi:MAG: hypothetical protein WC028_11890 [Candidatus Obscuribacterales bacterium]
MVTALAYDNFVNGDPLTVSKTMINAPDKNTESQPKIGTKVKSDSIDSHLQQMKEAADKKEYETVESQYQLALAKATVLVGGEAPLLLLLFCMARYYEAQSKLQHAEHFNRRARKMIIQANKQASLRESGQNTD